MTNSSRLQVERLSMVVWQASQSLQLIIKQARFGQARSGAVGGDAGSVRDDGEGWRPSLARLQALADLVASAEGQASSQSQSAGSQPAGRLTFEAAETFEDAAASAASTPALEPREWLAGPVPT